MGYKRKRRKKGRAGCATTAVTLVLVLVVAAVGYFGGFFGGDTTGDGDETQGAGVTVVNGEAEFHFIDVGQADAALICTTAGNVLIDAGTNASEDELKAYLDNKGITEIEYAIFTHPHEDHIGGADMIMNTYKVKHVILPQKEHDSQTYNKMMESIEKSKAEIIYATTDSVYTVGDLKMTLLAPQKDGYSELNDYSVVMRVDYGNTSALFTGDAEALSEKEMLAVYASGNKLDCDILKMGHHGSNSSSTQDFLNEVTPTYAVISCGKDNKYGHPHEETIDRLKAMQIPYVRTDETGSVVFVSNGENMTQK